MTPTNTCPRCGSGPYGGTSSHNRYECLTITWMDNGQIIHESSQCKINQLTTALSETNTKLRLALNREKDLKRLLDDIQLRRDNAARDLQTHRDANGALLERVKSLESAYAECSEKLHHSEQREHDLKRRLDDMRGQRDAFQSVVTDPHALWSNWLRGDIQLPAGIGDIRECAEKMKRFRSRWLAAHQELRKAENRIERAEERARELESSLRECTEQCKHHLKQLLESKFTP